MSTRVDIEGAGYRFRGDMPILGQQAVGFVDGEASDAVMAPVGGVEKTPILRRADL